MSNLPHRLDAIARTLRRYCAEHPHAADSLDGVRGWLGIARGGVSQTDLELVLAELEQEGCTSRRTLADGTQIFFSAAGRVERL